MGTDCPNLDYSNSILKIRSLFKVYGVSAVSAQSDFVRSHIVINLSKTAKL